MLALPQMGSPSVPSVDPRSFQDLDQSILGHKDLAYSGPYLLWPNLLLLNIMRSVGLMGEADKSTPKSTQSDIYAERTGKTEQGHHFQTGAWLAS